VEKLLFESYRTPKIRSISQRVPMTEEDPYRKWRKGRGRESQSDTQGGDKPLDMEDEEETETSRSVNEDTEEPDRANEEVDEKID